MLFLTGLSGSGKSTIARNLADVLAERGDRKVTLLDGDLVRQLLSAGLTFSRADRDLNIARIGFVAAEIARHGGIAICAPIAPYAAARARVRQMVSEVGDFLLIYVATPVEVCEARDRKGLYAKARAGLIDHFTGVSDPYEEPLDADLVIDTSTMTREQATEAVLGLLTSGGWLSPPGPASRDRGPGSVVVLGPGALVQPLAEAADPRRDRPGHRVPLPGQHDEADDAADHQRQRDQQQPAGTHEIEDPERDHEKQDPREGVGESSAHGKASLLASRCSR